VPRLRATMPTAGDVRRGWRRRLRRLRAEAWSLAQTAVAAAAAWVLAGLVNSNPFFAPVSAVIALGVARGRRTVRAIELAVGVAVGIAVADLIVLALGTGVLVLALVVALAMAAALLLGAGTILVNQAAISGILVVTITPPTNGLSPTRFVDALIGAGVALIVGQVLFPRDPVRAMGRAARPVASDLAVALEALAEALRQGDPARARAALEIARGTDDDLSAFYDAVALSRETVAYRRPLGRTRERLPLYAEAAQQMDYAVRNVRVLARRALAAARRGPAPAALADALSLLAQAVTALAEQLEDPDRDEAEVRRLALRAAASATSVLDDDPGLTISVIVGQVRSTAIDLLRSAGLSNEQARKALDEAVAGPTRSAPA
jgi:uncharacterized membrane protein YgaE (UPF0421/DUF939 family)